MFTRGQIEWAIAQVTGRTSGPTSEPRRDLQMKLKRLLDIDRKKGIDSSQAWPEFRRFAFLEGGLPGKGIAISYTAYDAFALLLGLYLLDSNVPQMAVIRLLRLIRRELEREHDSILQRFALARKEDAVKRRIEDGLFVEDPWKMVFLVLPTRVGADLLYRRKLDTIKFANITRSPAELVEVVAHLTRVSPPVLLFELINPVCQLASWLDRAPLVRRGRP